MITITQSPIDTQPIPVSDDLTWCLLPDDADVFDTPGAAAKVVITFPTTPTPQANGTAFKIWGFTFTFDNTYDFTGQSFRCTTTGFQSALFFRQMIEANLYFRRDVSVTISGAGFNIVTITWNSCIAQGSFAAPAMDFTNFTPCGATAVVTNGTSPVYKPGFKITFRLLQRDPVNQTNVLEVGKLEGIEPNRGCANAVAICLNLMRDARRFPYTPIPDLDDVGQIAGTAVYSMVQIFQLEYGWVYRDVLCQSVSGTIKKSDAVMVWNAAFGPEDAYGVRPYWPGAVGGFPSGQFFPKFLTTQPTTMRIATTTNIWLWFFRPDTFTTLRARFEVYSLADPNTPVTDYLTLTTNGENPVYGFNASPQQASSVSGVALSSIIRYFVAVTGTDGGGAFNAAGELQYLIDRTCFGTDMFFLTPAGGIGTLVCDLEAKETVQEGSEIYKEPTTGISRFDKARYQGRTLGNIRAYDRFTITAVEDYSVENKQWFMDFKKSPQRWIKVESNDGTYIARKFIVDAGSVKISQAGEQVILSATGYIGDTPVQNGNEPI